MEKNTAPEAMAAVEDSRFPLAASGFHDYTEAVPGVAVKFHMIAWPVERSPRAARNWALAAYGTRDLCTR